MFHEFSPVHCEVVGLIFQLPGVQVACRLLEDGCEEVVVCEAQLQQRGGDFGVDPPVIYKVVAPVIRLEDITYTYKNIYIYI